ncbi:hypothetical protein I314_06780 [Cryptococcus bacillisporus CA1873]|uniref:Uncharacterized protein n=1 Tax=Cryptococcus bacillisporus CA1873 TaxID=1296111 RepID=A0ABR5B219_CRYGA|nr:hypothetical protein I314_06780 [Cryptococcus bacillisporus CA1873]|eukprot:KIR57409.1 hypothetical protein I314_06780 [Cryptococcus gattii CA1873]
MSVQAGTIQGRRASDSGM